MVYLSETFLGINVSLFVQIALIIFISFINFLFICYFIKIIYRQKVETKYKNLKNLHLKKKKSIKNKKKLSKKDEVKFISAKNEKRNLFFKNFESRKINDIENDQRKDNDEDISRKECFQIIRIKQEEISFLKNKILKLENQIQKKDKQKKIEYLKKKDLDEEYCNHDNLDNSSIYNEIDFEENLFCEFNLIKDKNFFIFEKNKSKINTKTSFKLFESAYIKANYSWKFKKFHKYESFFLDLDINFESLFEIK